MKPIHTLLTLISLAALSLTSLGAATKSMVGQPLPALRLDYYGKKPEVKGKPAIIEFWATWCGPCKQTIPHLNEVNKQYKDKGLVIIGVTDEDNQTIRRFTKEVPMDYTPATDRSGKLSQAFGVTGIPHAVLADKTGKIVWEGHPMSLTNAEIEKVLN